MVPGSSFPVRRTGLTRSAPAARPCGVWYGMMKRRIVGFHLDDDGDWVAELDCYHGYHTRHRPPLVSRPWATNEEGRQSRIGAELQCARCERLEFPEGLEPVRRTPEFDQESVPERLLRSHATQTGVWGRIEVLEGELGYWVEAGNGREVRLTPSRSGVIVPEMAHRLLLKGPVRFFVEFFKREERGGGPNVG
jgi:tellurite methyltransferase